MLQVILENIRADAYVIIFSIAHRDTFDTAVDLLSELRMDMGTDRTVIMVGNKLDLVRKRKVKTEGKDRFEMRIRNHKNCHEQITLVIE